MMGTDLSNGVLVVGAGPTGLTLAAELGRRDVPCRLIDHAIERSPYSKAVAIQARTLLTRGAESDLLSRDTAVAMTQRGPHATLVEFEGVGHAPTFVDPAQIAVVTRFLFD